MKGAPYMNYEDALIWMGECDSTSFDHEIKNAISESYPFPDFKNLFTPIRNYASNILSCALEVQLILRNYLKSLRI